MASRKPFGPAQGKSGGRCALCGKAFEGKGGVCTACSSVPDPASASRRVAERVRDRVMGGETGGFVCPFCRAELTWENLRTYETEVTIYVREKIYACPKCRAFLGASSWHTEG